MKILCLGNNTEQTDVLTKKLAANNNSICYGLLSEIEQQLTENQYANSGYYHTSVNDIEFGRIIELAKSFDLIILLDIPKEEYSHPDAFLTTIRLLKEIAKTNHVYYMDQLANVDVDFFSNLVNTNKSFCIFPFIELVVNDNYTTVCCRSAKPIQDINILDNFLTDIEYNKIRKSMIDGELLDDYCKSCYDLEKQGILSARIHETVEWANRLNLKSIDDLTKISKPAYYEIRPSNKCNLQCRMCNPDSSTLIKKEYVKLGLISGKKEKQYKSFELIDFENLSKLYVAGGEPTAMPEFYDFLDSCIQTNNTKFEFIVNTNAAKISQQLKEKFKKFTNLQFIVSIDGYQDLNHYIRWPSNWSNIIKNMQYLQLAGHKIIVNVTVSIYNVSTLFQLFNFFDNQFPGVLIHAQYCQSELDRLSALNFPDRVMVLDNLVKITKTNCYNNDLLLKSFVDGLILQYQKNTPVDLDKLSKFFEFNDKLDQSRNINLSDYIPTLEKYRFLTKEINSTE